MKAIDYKKMGKEELAQALREAEARLRDLRFSLAANQLKDVREVRVVQKDIARIKTIMSQTK